MYTKVDIEKLLRDCEQAAKDGVDQELLWDWGKAWALLGDQSGEACDYKKAIQKFFQADKLACDLPHFRIDYGETLLSLAHLEGHPAYVDLALIFFQRAGASSMLAMAFKKRFELTFSEEDYARADTAFRDAILAEPHEVSLWLDWGDLHLQRGWIMQDPKIFEVALEKLTSKASRECNPFQLTAYVGRGLAMMGYLLDDLKALQESKARVLSMLDLAPDHTDLCYAAGMIHFLLGMYFSDVSSLSVAIGEFRAGLSVDARCVQNWHGIFQAYNESGYIQNDFQLAKNGLNALERLVTLRPYVTHYLNEWGIALMRTRAFAPQSSSVIEEALTRFRAAWEIRQEPNTRFNWACALDALAEITGEPAYLEEAIPYFHQAITESPQSLSYQAQFALSLSNYGNLTGDVESLERASILLDSISQLEKNCEELICQLGYNYFLLSELVQDPAFPEKAVEKRKEAEQKLLQAAELGSTPAYYHLACLYSISGLTDSALLFLRRAESASALPPADVLEDESWLDNIRDTEEFRHIVRRRKNGRE